MEKFTERHFFMHGKPGREAEKKACHWCQLRAFPNHERIPITIVNVVDDERLPQDFRFIQRAVYGKGVSAAEVSFQSGCSCDEAGDGCQYGDCHCLQDMREDEDGRSSPDAPVYSYHTRGMTTGLLRSELLDTKDPVYECHEECTCSKACPNRVVERGRTVPIQIFKTKDNRGFGVRCLENIQKGQFIDTYIGEIITPKEADRRRKVSDSAKKKDVYLFALDKFSDDESNDERLRGRSLEVDGEFMSGPTRFVNHSCDPNTRIFARVGDHVDKHLHDLAFFAIRDIPKGEELTFDYVAGNEDEQNEVDDKNMVTCLCGSENCRGLLW